MPRLPWSARFFVAGTICAAGVVLLTRLPSSLPEPASFIGLALGSSIASGLKLRLPLGAGASNLSVSYTIDFTSLLLLGADPAMLVTGLSACSQSIFSTARRNPPFRIVFNVAALILTVQAAGRVFAALGGQIAEFNADLIGPLVAAALTYYVVNTSTVATVVGLSTPEPIWRVWHQDFLWTAPSYLTGAATAAAVAAAWGAGFGWFIPLAAAPVYLTFRSYRIYLDRIAAEQRHREEMRRLHEQAVDALRAARESEQRYALAAEGSHDGLWDWDLAADFFYVSDRWKLMIGLPADSPIERVADWFRYVHAEDLADLRRALDRHLTGETAHFEHEYRVRDVDGQHRWVLCRGVAVRDEGNRPVRIAGSQTDVTERRRIRDKLAHAALHDSLTGLANRTLFAELLERALSKSRRDPAYSCAVLFVDLDRFKLINDSLGHLLGDRFLVAIAQRLLTHLRPGDALARFGGDEFAILLEQIGDLDAATAVADRLHAALLKPFDLEGREIYASASIGIAFGAGRCRSGDDLLRNADTAMYRAKALGRSQLQTFEPSMHTSAIERLTESFLLNGSDGVAERLDALRSIPVELYLDDFGTGFSSLSYLHRYRLDALKIDQSFISRIGGVHNDSPIVGSIVNLARELGMGVIAEGVETREQAAQLQALACPHAQGYLFSRPLSAAEAYAFLAAHPSPSGALEAREAL